MVNLTLCVITVATLAHTSCQQTNSLGTLKIKTKYIQITNCWALMLSLYVCSVSDTWNDVLTPKSPCVLCVCVCVCVCVFQELIPVLLGVVANHPDSKTRDQLIHIMFNLIKRPDRHQRYSYNGLVLSFHCIHTLPSIPPSSLTAYRQMIMNGCVEYAKMCGSLRVESELLPQMWEQISHKYYERRLLVAEACGVLAPYTPVSLPQ